MTETDKVKTERAPDAEPEKKDAGADRPAEPSVEKESGPDPVPGAPHKNKEKNLKKEYQKLQKDHEALKRDLLKAQKELEQSKQTEEAQNDRYLRMMAEYDNFRKRSAAEKDAVYAGAVYDIFKEILPVIDALELAVRYGKDAHEGEQVLKGVEMTLQKFSDALSRLGVEEVETKTFDPNCHNAVMHVEDEAYGEGEILEVFQKGYKKGDKIIRYAMVKVAN